jgi:hypothetical protein
VPSGVLTAGAAAQGHASGRESQVRGVDVGRVEPALLRVVDRSDARQSLEVGDRGRAVDGVLALDLADGDSHESKSGTGRRAARRRVGVEARGSRGTAV